MNIFGKLHESVEIITRKEQADGTVETVFKFGNLTVIGQSNKPSSAAIERLCNGMNRIAKRDTA